jgi:molybdate/tungstate transport system substrate-binding protein
MWGRIMLHIREYGLRSILLVLFLAPTAVAQTTGCVPMNNQQLIIYRAGSLTRAFTPLVAAFTCQTGIQVKDIAMGSVDAARQITAGGQPSDLYAPADYMDIDLFLKPAGYADFNIVFAQGKMVLAYSANSIGEKKLPPIVAPGSQPFHPPASIPNTAPDWYSILTMPGVVIGGGHPFLDPGAYRADMIFQLAQEYYHVPNLYNNLLKHLMVPAPGSTSSALGKQFDFQLTYEHNAQASASKDPDMRYVNLPDEINLSDAAKNAWYGQHASIVLPGLGTPGSARTVTVSASRVAWGICILKNAPHPEAAVRFLQLLLGRTGTDLLRENGPAPISPALVSHDDLRRIPESIRPLLKETKSAE